MRLGADVLELDLYEVLGVKPGADIDELRAAYRQRARESHPDLNPDDARSAERMVQINIAFRVLLDPALRSAYELGRRRRLQASAHTNESSAASEWYERAASGAEDWSAPAANAATAEQRASCREFLREVRRVEARWSLRLFELATSAPAHAQFALLATCIIVAAGLIGWVGVVSPQPTSVNPHMLYP